MSQKRFKNDDNLIRKTRLETKHLQDDDDLEEKLEEELEEEEGEVVLNKKDNFDDDDSIFDEGFGEGLNKQPNLSPKKETVILSQESKNIVNDFLSMMDEMRSKKDFVLKEWDDKIVAADKEIEEAYKKKEEIIKARNEFAVMVNEPEISLRKSSRSKDGSKVRKPRMQNGETLRSCVSRILGDLGKANLKTISSKILESGYKTTSSNFEVMVRQQIYKLIEENLVKSLDDGTYSVVR